MRLPVVLAYIDPVSGTILLQLIIAGVLGCMGFFHRTIWRVCRAIVGHPQTEKETEKTESDP